MRKLVLKMHLSIDGFVSGPSGRADWIFATQGPEMENWLVETLSSAELHLVGSQTFRDMAAYWPLSPSPVARPMNRIPKVVFSSGGVPELEVGRWNRPLQDATYHDSTRDGGAVPASAADYETWIEARSARRPLRQEIRDLKESGDGTMIAHGGATFAKSLIREGVVDEYWLVTHPVALGSGLSIFSGLDEPLNLQAHETIEFEHGAIARVLRPN